MIILKKDFKHNLVSLKVTSSDDLWYLSHIISPRDIVTMKTERKIKLNNEGDRNVKVVRKTIVLTLDVETIEYNSSLHQLRVKGKVLSGPEDVPKGSYHTFGIDLDSSFTLEKKSWPTYILNKLNEASKISKSVVIVVVFNREEAQFSIIKQSGIEHLSNIKANVSKKDYQNETGESIYALIIKELTELNKQYQPSNIICASPAFWKIYLSKILPSDLNSKTVFATCSDVNKGIVGELIMRPELKQIISSQRTSEEMTFVNNVLEKLDKNYVVYGFEDVKNSALNGAISEIGFTDSYVQKIREENKYEQLDEVLLNVDSSKGTVHFISSEDASKIINGLGGVVGILRWI